jgi:hypothetical protein
VSAAVQSNVSRIAPWRIGIVISPEIPASRLSHEPFPPC